MGDVRQEPSMEEILSSIKRIIAEDGAAVSTPRARRGAVEAAGAVSAPAAAPAPAAVPTPPVVPPPAAAAPEPAAPPAPPPAPPPPPPVVEPDPAGILELTHAAPERPMLELVSADALSASKTRLEALSAMVVRGTGADNTLEALVREMLRPMLKEWLDARLPEIVESLVAREISRITGGQKG
jgi:cell pole-organizing protein PopZ